MKKFLVVVLILGLAGGGAFWWFQEEEKAPSHILTLYGNVDIRQVRLAFEVSGRIGKILVEEGDLVEPGGLVAEVTPERYQARAGQARAEAAAAGQVLDQLLAGSRPEEIRTARAKLDSAMAEFKDSEKLYDRHQVLVKTGSITQQTMDNTQARYQAAQAAVKQGREQLALAVKGPRDEEIKAARARLEAAEAGLALANKDLKDTRLVSPARAVVQKRVLEPGDMASPQSPVLTLALVDPVWVRAYLSETDLGKVKPGMAVQVETDSYPGKKYEGWVGYISPTAEFTPKEVETPELRTKLVYWIRVHVRNPENELRLGMPVTVGIDTSAKAAKAVNPQEGSGRGEGGASS